MWVVCQFTGSRFPHVATRKRQNRKSIPPPRELSCVFYASTFLMIMIIINPIPTCSQSTSTGTGTGTGSLPLAATTTTTHHQQLTTTTTTTATATTTTSAGLQGHNRPPAEPTADPACLHDSYYVCIYVYSMCKYNVPTQCTHTHTPTQRETLYLGLHMRAACVGSFRFKSAIPPSWVGEKSATTTKRKSLPR